MTSKSRARLDKTLAKLRAKVIRELPERVAGISVLSRSIAAADALARPPLQNKLERAAHGIAGRAALFDLPSVYQAAIDLETRAADVSAICDLVVELSRACDAARSSGTDLSL